MNVFTAIDLETTGLPRDMALDDPNYPRMVQIGGVTWTSDNVTHGRIMNYVQQRDKRTSRGAENVHGIKDQLSNSQGIKEAVAVSWILSILDYSDHVIGWSLNFDLDIVRAALIRHGKDPKLVRSGCRPHDLQELMLVDVGKTFEDGTQRLPKLTEGYEHLFGKPLYLEGEKHDASKDAEACREIFVELWRLGKIDMERKAA